MKVVQLDRAYWPRGGYGHWCPGCRSGHEIDTEQPNTSGAKWTFDGNVDAPTFTPSVNIKLGWADGGSPGYPGWVLHDQSARNHEGDRMKGMPTDLRELSLSLYKRLGVDAMLRQHDPVDTIMAYLQHAIDTDRIARQSLPKEKVALAHLILSDRCACYGEAWPAETCDRERDLLAADLESAFPVAKVVE